MKIQISIFAFILSLAFAELAHSRQIMVPLVPAASESHQRAFLSHRTTVETGPFEPIIGDGTEQIIQKRFNVSDPYFDTVLQGTNLAISKFPTTSDVNLIIEEVTASSSNATLQANDERFNGLGITKVTNSNSNSYLVPLTPVPMKKLEGNLHIKLRLSIESSSSEDYLPYSTCSAAFIVGSDELYDLKAYAYDGEEFIVLGYYIDGGKLVPIIEFYEYGKVFEVSLNYPINQAIDLYSRSDCTSEMDLKTNDQFSSISANTIGWSSTKFSVQLRPKHVPVFDDFYE